MAAVDPVIRGVAVSVAPSRLPPHLDRDDLVAEARMAALRAVRAYRGGPEALTDYLAVSCRNAVLKALRDTYRIKRGVRETYGGAPAEAALAAARGPTPTPLESLEQDERFRRLLDLLDRLAPKDREIISAYYLRGETDAEIAARLGYRRVTVTGRRLDALARLRTLLETQD